jgi:hypothetical protein
MSKNRGIDLKIIVEKNLKESKKHKIIDKKRQNKGDGGENLQLSTLILNKETKNACRSAKNINKQKIMAKNRHI